MDDSLLPPLRLTSLHRCVQMSYFKSLPADAGPPHVFSKYPSIYEPWSGMSQALMNGPSPLTQGERELILAYAAGLGGCEFVCVAHSEVAYAWGIEQGLVESLLDDPHAAPIDSKLKPLLAFLRKLVLTPNGLSSNDAESVFEAGWDEQALHDAIAIAARAAFMQRLVQGCGFAPMTREIAASHAKKRVERGYVNVYSAFRDRDK